MKSVVEGETGKMVGEIGGKRGLTRFRIAVKGKRPIAPLHGQMMRFLNL